MIGILKHKIADCVRKSRSDRWLDLDAVESPPDDDPRADPFAALFHRSFLERLAHGLQHLPDAGARVFVARDVLGMDTAQTAHEVGLTLDNCSVVLHRARTRLRDHLRPFSPGIS
jgi:DNA-directed RNA polymerase specialized sigma24 family protein